MHPSWGFEIPTGVQNAMPATEEGYAAAQTLLSTIYSELPFIEMKKEGYDYWVRLM